MTDIGAPMFTMAEGTPMAQSTISGPPVAAFAATGGVEECRRMFAQAGDIDLPVLAVRFGVRHRGPARF